MKNHGFFQVIDLEAAIENWQLIENRGAVAPEYTEGLEDRKDLPDKEEQRERNKIYQSILSLLKYNLTDLQAFLIRGNYPLDYWDTQEFIAFDFSQFSRALIVGKAQDNNWVSLCPTFPNEISYYKQNTATKTLHHQNSNKLQIQIEGILEELRPIQIYGVYGGGYDYIYQHQIICNVSKSKEKTIEELLETANMLNIREFNESNVITFLGGDWELAAFLDEKLEEINIYELSFWCVATRYLIGRIETKDWLGISSDTQMHYNP